MKTSSNLYKSMALLLAGTLLLVGCGKTEENQLTQVSGSMTEQSSENTSTMGRFVEKKVELPTELFMESKITQTEGMVRITGNYEEEMISDDGGNSFLIDDNLPQAYIDAIEESPILDVTVTTQGAHLVTSYIRTENSSSEGYITRSLITADNQQFVLPELSEEYMSIYCGDNGYFYAVALLTNDIYQIDPVTAAVTVLFQADDMVGYVAVCNKYLFAAGRDFLNIYDLEKKNMAEQDSVLEEFLKNELKNYNQGTISFLISQGPEPDSIYVLTEKGLYKHVVYGSTMEQIIDGSICRIGDISKKFRGMAALGNDIFLVLFEDALMRYTYDPNIPAVPDKTLRVYSMYEDANVKLAASAFRREYPEMYIKYEIGITDNTGVTREDALKSLSTEIAAGNGPDVLLMDDIPYESYAEKGALMDISELVSGGEEELFDNVINSFRKDDTLYTVPATFLLPLFTGNKDKVENVKTLSQLADLLEETRKETPEGSIISIASGKDVLEMFALASGGAWVKEDGSLNKEAITEFLTDCKRIYDAQMSGIGEEVSALYHEYYTVGSFAESIGQYGEHDLNRMLRIGIFYFQPFSAGYYTGTPVAMAHCVSMVRENRGVFVNMPGQMQNVCIPVTLLSINNATKMPEEAKAFLQFFISSSFLSDAPIWGAPINKKAYEDKHLFDLSMQRNLDDAYGTANFPRMDNSIVSIGMGWPRPREFKNLNAIVESLEGVCICDYRVYQAVMELGEPAMTGEASIEEAADAIEKKVQLYLAE